MLATYCLETTGTQEYKFTKEDFLKRFRNTYGDGPADEISQHLVVNLQS
jgi:adenosine kinase